MVEKRGSRDTFGGSPVEEACDERSKPQDVTSTWTGREGINLPQEVEPQSAEISPRNSLPKDTAERKSTVEMNIQSAVRGVGIGTAPGGGGSSVAPRQPGGAGPG